MPRKATQAKNAPAPRRVDLLVALNRVTREASGLGAIFAKVAADHLGISHSDMECIDIIALKGRITAGELAAASGLTTGAVTGVIDRLEAKGYARRERDPDDRRKVYVSILPRTLAASETHYGPFGAAMNALAERYSDAELALFIDYFSRSRDIIRGEIARLQSEAPPNRARSPRRGAGAAGRRPLRPPRA